MIKRIRAFAVVLLILLAVNVNAQELRCRVTVNADQVQASNKRIFKTLETAVFEFLNNYRWTKDNYTLEERIDCAVLINITSYTAPDQFGANIQITATRPVYNTGYSSTLLNYRDPDFAFQYLENSPIEYIPDQFRSNLSAVLAFYANVIIGYDYDSFSLEGGTEYFAEAQRIVSNAQNSGAKGWTASENLKNRFWLVDNALQQSFQPLRKCFYDYHRLGLDLMYDKTDQGRKKILESIEGLKSIHQIKPLSFNVQLFFNAKTDEIINLFSKAPVVEKARIVAVCKLLDPANGSKYEAINKN